MNKKFLTATLAITLVLTTVITGCSRVSNTSNKKITYSKNIPAKISSNKGPLKIMVISKIGGDDFTAQYLAGSKQEGKSMGFQVDTLAANGDTAKFHDDISQALEKGYDGIVISHGDDAATVSDVKNLVNNKIPVVTFDSNIGIKNIKEVTTTTQNDEALAKLALGQLQKTMEGKGNLAYLWVNGYPPMISRNKIYKQYLAANPGVKEVTRFGVADANTSVETQNAVEAMLNKYPSGKLNIIYASWDAFAIGATRAVIEAKRKDVKIVGMDVSNSDLQIMQLLASPWIATVAVDPKLIGSVDIRILAKKIVGEKTPQSYALQGSLITQEELKSAGKTINMANLHEVVPGFGKSNAFLESWMTELKGLNK